MNKLVGKKYEAEQEQCTILVERLVLNAMVRKEEMGGTSIPFYRGLITIVGIVNDLNFAQKTDTSSLSWQT